MTKNNAMTIEDAVVELEKLGYKAIIDDDGILKIVISVSEFQEKRLSGIKKDVKSIGWRKSFGIKTIKVA